MQQIFKRVEKKYLLTPAQYEELMIVLLEHMSTDQYGRHTICNIYYDNDNNDLIRTSIEKPRYKEKFRVRSYGVPTADDTVFLEIKKKYNKVVYKRRIPVQLKIANEILEKVNQLDGISEHIVEYDVNNTDYPVFDEISNRQIMHEIEYMIKHYDLKPDTFIAYDRVALYGIDDPALRITFDQNVRGRTEDLTLDAGDHGEYLVGDDRYLMEIKTNGAMPLWLAKQLSTMQIYPFSFSKYGNIYKKRILEVYNND